MKKILSWGDFQNNKTGIVKGGKPHTKKRSGKEGWKTLSEGEGFRVKNETEEGFRVKNETDDIYASPDTFDTEEKASDFIQEFIESFKKQGYYLDAQHNKIPVEELVLSIVPA